MFNKIFMRIGVRALYIWTAKLGILEKQQLVIIHTWSLDVHIPPHLLGVIFGVQNLHI